MGASRPYSPGSRLRPPDTGFPCDGDAHWIEDPDDACPGARLLPRRAPGHSAAAMSQSRYAVVLLSGGLDSMTAAARAREDGFRLPALTIDYNQRQDRKSTRLNSSH